MQDIAIPDWYRRRFLKAVLGASGALALTPLGRARAQALADIHVVVVGAGIAGLGAARSLADQGAKVIVLEAKPHIGGRLLTDYSLGAPFEVGAGWIHGPGGGNPVAALASDIDAKTFVTEDDSLIVYDATGKKASPDAIEKLDRDISTLLDRLDEELENSNTSSLRDAIKQLSPKSLNDPLMLWALTAFIEFSTGGPIEKLSATGFDDDDQYPDDDVILTVGYDRILKPLSGGLDIRLSTRVSQVSYNGDGVSVGTDNGSVEADYCVCNLPLGVLKAGSVSFSPPLPSNHAKRIAAIPMGNVTKIALMFEQAFWPVDTQYFGFMNPVKGKFPYFINYRTFTDNNILVGLCFGDYVVRTTKCLSVSSRGAMRGSSCGRTSRFRKAPGSPRASAKY